MAVVQSGFGSNAMKVTVCFGDDIRVVVPCGQGDMLVSELMQLAAIRYRKATGKSFESLVSVHNLRSLDGGILDPDDRVQDVIDDRERILAVFTEHDSGCGVSSGGEGGGSHIGCNKLQRGGDGTSAGSSSTGTSNPDLFHLLSEPQATFFNATLQKHFLHGDDQMLQHSGKMRTIDKFQNSAKFTTNLQRPNSEPSLNNLVLKDDEDNFKEIGESFQTFIDENENILTSQRLKGHETFDQSEEGLAAFSQFTRDHARKSLCNNAAMHAWLEAQERLQDGPRAVDRKDPVGCSDNVLTSSDNVHTRSTESIVSGGSMIVLENSNQEKRSLGIHVIPDTDELGRSIGLTVEGVEPEGRIHEDGRIHVGDRIIEINGTSLIDVDFKSAQEIFARALQTATTRLRVVFTCAAPPPPPPPHYQRLPPSPWHALQSRKPLPSLPPATIHNEPGPTTSTPSKDPGLIVDRLIPPTTIKKQTPLTLRKQIPDANTEQAPGTTDSVRPELLRTVTKQQQTNPDFNAYSCKKQAPLTATKQQAPPPPTPGNRARPLVPHGSVQKYVAPSSELKRQPYSKSSLDVVHGSIVPGCPASPAVPVKSSSSSSLSSTSQKSNKPRLTSAHNTRMIGKKLYIELLKGPEGLGFSITTRDNPAGSNCPIYVKNIMPQGAAVQDGRLQPGDRLLEVNGVDLSEMMQDDVVQQLRSLQLGGVVSLTVSRQLANNSDEISADKNNYNSEDRQDRHDIEAISEALDDNDVYMFIIPLSDPGGAETGLGISVKGRSTPVQGTGGVREVGLFVKSILDSGAAAKDGRLRPDDRILEVNGISLVSRSNALAMEILRESMQRCMAESQESISFVIARSKRSNTQMALPMLESVAKTPHNPLSLAARVSEFCQDQQTEVVSTKTSLSTAKRPPPVVPPPSALKERKDNITRPTPVKEFRSPKAVAPRPMTTQHRQEKIPSPPKTTTKASRNISYQRATSDSILCESGIGDREFANEDGKFSSATSSSTVIGRRAEAAAAAASNSRATTSGGHIRAPSTQVQSKPVIRSSCSDTELKSFDCMPTPPHWMPDWNKNPDATFTTSGSPPDIDPMKVFSREALGRQSMSEKRKCHLDPRTSSFYQNLKAGKSENDNTQVTLKKATSAESILSQSNYILTPKLIGRTGGMRESLMRFTSVENLRTMNRERQILEGFVGGPPIQTGMLYQGRTTTNDGFKAPTTGTYDRQTATISKTKTDSIYPVSEEELDSESGGHDLRPAVKDGEAKKVKKEKGLFKGLFRFGKSKKEEPVIGTRPKETVREESKIMNSQRKEVVKTRSFRREDDDDSDRGTGRSRSYVRDGRRERRDGWESDQQYGSVRKSRAVERRPSIAVDVNPNTSDDDDYDNQLNKYEYQQMMHQTGQVPFFGYMGNRMEEQYASGRRSYTPSECCAIYQNFHGDFSASSMRPFEPSTPYRHPDHYHHQFPIRPPLPHPYQFYTPSYHHDQTFDQHFPPAGGSNIYRSQDVFFNEPSDRHSQCIGYGNVGNFYPPHSGGVMHLPPTTTEYHLYTPRGHDQRREGGQLSVREDLPRRSTSSPPPPPPVLHRRIKTTGAQAVTHGRAPPPPPPGSSQPVDGERMGQSEERETRYNTLGRRRQGQGELSAAVAAHL